MIDNVILTTENCRYCLMCRHVCPVAHVTRKETLSPHGWGLTIASIRRGLLELNSESVSTLYSCADCGTCRANCVTDQPLPSAIAAMRQEIVDQELAPPIVTELDLKLKRWSNPHVEEVPGEPKLEGTVALFVGDDARYLDDETLPAALTLLEAVGVNPVQIGIGRNNGYLASSLGLHSTAAQLIRATLLELETCGAKTMLVLSPGDYYAFGQMSEERLGIEWPSGVNLQEVTLLLAEHLATGKLNVEPFTSFPPAAYVDPTHSVRVSSRYEAPRELISAILPAPPVELFWRRDRTHPCGNVALQYTEPHISDHLTYSRLGDARQSGAQILMTEDSGTLSHLKRHENRFGLETRNLYRELSQRLVSGQV